jgi:exopolysaccharide biosynthesis polyprenyl glycosylphosphotransferase
MAPGVAAVRSMALGGLGALRAQAVIDRVALRFAPAATAGIIAAGHLGSPGAGLIVGMAALGASTAIERPQLPLHLIPGSRVSLALLAPAAGILAGWATLRAAGSVHALGDLLPAFLGAWLTVGLAGWIKVRFERRLRARVAVVGPAAFAADLTAEFAAAGIGTYVVVGAIGESGAQARNVAMLGSLGAIRSLVGRMAIDLIVVAPGSAPGTEEAIAEACLDLPVKMIAANQLYEELLGHVPLGTIDSHWFRYIMHPRFDHHPGPGQRLSDLVLGSLIAALALPVLALAAVAIRLEDGAPALYRQRRIGARGREFRILKLRTMRVDSEPNGPRLAVARDARVTRVGRLLRRTHIDELPQLWNVLRGEMTLVGPRPERPEMVMELESRFHHYNRRHLVKPGLTGWAQVRCGYAGSESGTAWKLCHDLYYLKHRSPLGDALILTQTVFEAWRDAHRVLRAPRPRFILGAEPTA